MPFGNVELKPGVNVERTPTLNEAGYSESAYIRWKDGLAQKLGGWTQYYPFALDGVPRALHAWQDLNETSRLSIGTTTALNILSSNTLADITPREKITNGATFETTTGDATVTITDAGATGITALEHVFLNTPIAVGGLILSAGYYPVQVLGANTYSIEATAAATATRTDSTATVTISNASPAVVGWTAHGLSAGQQVRFTSTGTLPTGITAGATYYVAASGLNTNDFQITDIDGVVINTSSAGSGTITGLAFHGAVPKFQTLNTNATETVVLNTVTISIATPGVVSWTGHGLQRGQAVLFATTGALPTGITAGTKYFVSGANLGANSFELSTSYANALAGTSLATSGTQSGTQNIAVLGSQILSVTMANHGLSQGDTVNFPLATSLGSGTLATSVFGTYTVTDVSDANTFTISIADVTAQPGLVAMNSNRAQIRYAVTPGVFASGSGYGVGGWGDGGYGEGTTPSGLIGTSITATNWSLDNWGSTLLACPENGGVYAWNPSGGNQVAQVVHQAPPFNGGLFVAMPAQILVAWGSTAAQNIGVDQDPLLIKWSDQLDFTNWTVSTTTQAGSYRIPTGSKIVGALQGPQSALIWTDLDVYAMQYIGYPLVFGFNKIGASCGLIGRNAAGQLGGRVFWMSSSNFFALTGKGAEPLPCPVWDRVFQDLDTANAAKCVCAPNTVFNEIWWFYPSLSGGTGEPDKYVKLNTLEGAWDYGDLRRSAWIDQSLLGMPIGAAPQGTLFQHEVGEDAAGEPLTASFTTGYWRVGDGQNWVFVDQIIPDMRWGLLGGNQDADLRLTFYAKGSPADTPAVYGPYTMTAATTQISTRIRGRQIALKIESSDSGSFWRLGKISYRWALDGRR